MIRIVANILLLLFIPTLSVCAQKDSLTAFIERNPNAVDFNVIYEGTKLNLSSDDNYLLVNLSVAHPALQMRFLMQKVSLYIDPSGKKRKIYEIVLPSAFDVKEELEAAIPRPDTVAKTEGDARPDIRPLIRALNKKGADFNYSGGKVHIGYQFFHIEMDTQKDLLNYYVLLPKEKLMQDRKLSDQWAIGIFSINDYANMPTPEQDGEGGMMPPPMDGEDQQSIQELMQNDIRLWTKFSIDDVNNANLQDVAEPTLISVDAMEHDNNIELQIVAFKIETQLAFLMQGLTIHVEQPDTIILSFPSAPMVRNKVKRHPNEVKAVLTQQQRLQTSQDSIHQVVRPDVQPLVSALNDTTATITYQNAITQMHNFIINVDRKEAIMTFSIKIPKYCLAATNDYIALTIISEPINGSDGREFVGSRLSGENAPRPNGLGEGLRGGDASSRTFRKNINVKISKQHEQ